MIGKVFDSLTWRRFLAGNDVQLGNRQMFMMPTRMGYFFTLLLFTLLLAAINYENSLSYALTFMLAALAQVSMLYTHRNLLGVRFLAGACEPVFAGQVASFRFSLRNDKAKPRYQIQLIAQDRVFTTVDLGAHAQQRVILECAAKSRGWMPIPDIKAQTSFPLGLLYTWTTRICLEQKCLVYPHPAPAGNLPVPGAGFEKEAHGENERGEDFAGLREYRKGDSLKQIHWKALARGQGMQTKQYGGGSGEDLWLEWDALSQMDPEKRLQQLCRWVLDAEELEINYGLRLPGLEIRPGSGADHRHHCLKTLALFETNE